MTNTLHQDAVQANKDSFNEDFARKYEQRESQRILSLLFLKHILEMEVSTAPIERKSEQESAKILGDASLPLNGFTKENTLPNPKTYLTNYPNTIFRPGMKLLDFACGTGMVTELFVPYLTGHAGEKSEIVGIDIGPTFLKYFNERAEKYSNENISMRSYEYDILDSSISKELNKFDSVFDAIVCTISYHHIHNYEQVTKKLATFLKPGGWLFIIDFYNEDVENSGGSKEAGNGSAKAVQHMGGLKKDKLNHTLGDISGLKNVSSAREFRTQIYQPKEFIVNHCPEEITKRLERGELKERKGLEGEVDYLVEVSLIYAIGQKP